MWAPQHVAGQYVRCLCSNMFTQRHDAATLHVNVCDRPERHSTAPCQQSDFVRQDAKARDKTHKHAHTSGRLWHSPHVQEQLLPSVHRSTCSCQVKRSDADLSLRTPCNSGPPTVKASHSRTRLQCKSIILFPSQGFRILHVR